MNRYADADVRNQDVNVEIGRKITEIGTECLMDFNFEDLK